MRERFIKILFTLVLALSFYGNNLIAQEVEYDERCLEIIDEIASQVEPYKSPEFIEHAFDIIFEREGIDIESDWQEFDELLKEKDFDDLESLRSHIAKLERFKEKIKHKLEQVKSIFIENLPVISIKKLNVGICDNDLHGLIVLALKKSGFVDNPELGEHYAGQGHNEEYLIFLGAGKYTRSFRLYFDDFFDRDIDPKDLSYPGQYDYMRIQLLNHSLPFKQTFEICDAGNNSTVRGKCDEILKSLLKVDLDSILGRMQKELINSGFTLNDGAINFESKNKVKELRIKENLKKWQKARSIVMKYEEEIYEDFHEICIPPLELNYLGQKYYGVTLDRYMNDYCNDVLTKELKDFQIALVSSGKITESSLGGLLGKDCSIYHIIICHTGWDNLTEAISVRIRDWENALKKLEEFGMPEIGRGSLDSTHFKR